MQSKGDMSDWKGGAGLDGGDEVQMVVMYREDARSQSAGVRVKLTKVMRVLMKMYCGTNQRND